jgi:hypothetical protein
MMWQEYAGLFCKLCKCFSDGRFSTLHMAVVWVVLPQRHAVHLAPHQWCTRAVCS